MPSRLRNLFLALLLMPFGATPALPACDRAKFVVAIDIGHTPRKPGATSARGKAEYRFNRKLALRIVDELHRAGFGKVIDTNPVEAEIELLDRSALANHAGASVFLSIHHDSAQPQLLSSWTIGDRSLLYTDQIAGHSLFVSERNGDYAGSLRLARLVGARLRAACLRPTLHHADPIPGEGRPLIDESLGIYRFDELAVLRSTRMPAVLIEAGVIVNRHEELVLRSTARRTLLAEAITRAVIDHCEASAPIVEPPAHCR